MHLSCSTPPDPPQQQNCNQNTTSEWTHTDQTIFREHNHNSHCCAYRTTSTVNGDTHLLRITSPIGGTGHSLLFFRQPCPFITEPAKVVFIITHQTGQARLWVYGRMGDNLPPTFKDFLDKLWKILGWKEQRKVLRMVWCCLNRVGRLWLIIPLISRLWPGRVL